MIVDYDKTVAEYHDSLFTLLRGFRPDPAFLESWVPDQDDARSALNMLEAAEAAGLAALDIRFGPSSRDRLSRARLASLAAGLGRMEMRDTDEGLVLHVDFDGEARVASVPASTPAPAPTRPLRAAEAGAHAEPQRLPADRLNPVYLEAVRALGGRIRHEGAPSPADGLAIVECARDGVTLAAAIEPATHVVRQARHRGASAGTLRALLEGLCEVMEGRPLQECSDHALIRLENRLRDRDQRRPVDGVLAPENAGGPFPLLAGLVRGLARRYREDVPGLPTENTYDPPPSAAWQEASDDTRRARIDQALQAFAAARGLSASALACLGVERGARVTVAFAPDVAAGAKPSLLMAAERALKTAVEPALHLYAEEMEDRNKIRRL